MALKNSTILPRGWRYVKTGELYRPFEDKILVLATCAWEPIHLSRLGMDNLGVPNGPWTRRRYKTDWYVIRRIRAK